MGRRAFAGFSPADVVFYAVAAFLCGIFVASIDGSFVPVLIGLFLTWIIWCMYDQMVYWKEAILMTLALAIGAFYFHAWNVIDARQPMLPSGKRISFLGIVAGEPGMSGSSVTLRMTPTSPAAREVMLFSRGGQFHYGELLQVTGRALPSRDPRTEIVLAQSTRVIEEHRGSRIIEVLFHIKSAILARFDESLPKDEAALLGGITFGTKQNFDDVLKRDMSNSGTTHLVAISGYNITIIIVIALRMFGAFFSRRTVFVLTSVFILLFVLMTGSQASAIRAAIMGFLTLLAREWGRPAHIRNAIVVSAAVMACFDPTILAKNAGFELSFMSLVGLVYLEPRLRGMFGIRDDGYFSWKANAVTTFSAQLGVLPVILHVFGAFSALAIVANVLVLSTVPLAMFLGFALAGAAFLFGPLTFFVAALARILLSYELGVIRFFGTFTLPIPFAFASGTLIVAYYAALGVFVFTHEAVR